MIGVNLPNQVYAHIAGIDLVRVAENDFYVSNSHYEIKQLQV
jgi:uncharacterized circularly permuted ATP-grasp superfamily protein